MGLLRRRLASTAITATVIGGMFVVAGHTDSGVARMLGGTRNNAPLREELANDPDFVASL